MCSFAFVRCLILMFSHLYSDTEVHATAVGSEALLNVSVPEKESAEKELIIVKDTEPDPAAHKVSKAELNPMLLLQ